MNLILCNGTCLYNELYKLMSHLLLATLFQFILTVLGVKHEENYKSLKKYSNSNSASSGKSVQ